MSIDRELTADDYSDAYGKSVMTFISHAGLLKETRITLDGSAEYSVPSDCDRPVEVIPPESPISGVAYSYGAYTGFGFENEGFPADPALVGGSPLANIEISSQFSEMFSRAIGKDFQWEWLEFTRKIRISPASLTGECAVNYVTSDIDWTKFSIRVKMLLYDYMLGEMKERLGAIRRKYQDGIIGVNGSAILDGDALVLEGGTLKDKAEAGMRGLYPQGGRSG